MSVPSAMRMACLAVLLVGLVEGFAATITNHFEATLEWRLFNLAVNVGDTVMWVNEQPLFLGTNYVESYGGEWRSPPLLPGDSFSFTFTNAGFYAYRTGLTGALLGVTGVVARAGTVTALPWTGAPPAVTISMPVEGSTLDIGYWLQASVTNAEAVAEVHYFANSTFVGSATNPPYEISWDSGLRLPAPPAPYVLVAKAIDRQGGAAWSRAVHVMVEPTFDVWGARVLPTGELLFFYNASASSPRFYIGTSDSLLTPWTLVAHAVGSGAFVDETVRGWPIPARFYAGVLGFLSQESSASGLGVQARKALGAPQRAVTSNRFRAVADR